MDMALTAKMDDELVLHTNADFLISACTRLAYRAYTRCMLSWEDLQVMSSFQELHFPLDLAARRMVANKVARITQLWGISAQKYTADREGSWDLERAIALISYVGTTCGGSACSDSELVSLRQCILLFVF